MLKRTIRGTVTLLSCLLTLAAALVATPTVAAAPDTDVDAYVAAQVQSAHIPGLAVGIVNADGSVRMQGFGVADPSGRLVDPHTPFTLGSMSKSFTALAIMQLCREGAPGGAGQ